MAFRRFFKSFAHFWDLSYYSGPDNLSGQNWVELPGLLTLPGGRYQACVRRLRPRMHIVIPQLLMYTTTAISTRHT